MKTNLAILAVLAFCNSVFAEIKTETVSVLMRDGIKLVTDVYRDDGGLGRSSFRFGTCGGPLGCFDGHLASTATGIAPDQELLRRF